MRGSRVVGDIRCFGSGLMIGELPFALGGVFPPLPLLPFPSPVPLSLAPQCPLPVRVVLLLGGQTPKSASSWAPGRLPWTHVRRSWPLRP